MTSVNTFPTRLLAISARTTMADMQRRLGEAQIESTTGRHHDIGLSLGSRMSADIGLRTQLGGIEQTMDGSADAFLLAEATQTGLGAISDLADHFRSMLTGLRFDREGRALGAATAQSSLGALRDLMSTTLDGKFIFSGLASDTPPLNVYENGPRQAVLDAFQQEFGFSPDDPAASSVTASQILDFVDGAFADLFSDPDWSSVWSSASDRTPAFRLPSGQGFSLSTTAKAPFASAISSAFTIIEVFGHSNVNADAFRTAVDKSLTIVSEAQGRIADEQSRIGLGQAQLKLSLSALETRKASIETALSAFESVDPYEAATRVNSLLAQLEGSYALTGRISRLSLLNYI